VFLWAHTGKFDIDLLPGTHRLHVGVGTMDTDALSHGTFDIEFDAEAGHVYRLSAKTTKTMNARYLEAIEMTDETTGKPVIFRHPPKEETRKP
jgi:hypothetical protein